jgi:hypothetical protein
MSGADVRTLRPAEDEYDAYYRGYVAAVPDGDIASFLESQLGSLISLLASAEPGAGERRYAPGKWSVAQVLGHVADAERIFACRLLRFSRGDATPLPGFDENLYAASDGVEGRPLAELLAELAAVRAATLALIRGLPEAAWTRHGVASGAHCTVRALAWIMAGHALHHETILRTRYLVAAEA